MTPEPDLVVGSKYKLVRPLGEGGMGTVWVARHTQLDVDVAVKLMAPALAGTPSAVARFEREAKAAAQLKSPHVVHIHDYGVEDGSPYIVMEMLEGEDLDALLQRDKRLSLARAAEILGQAAKALRAAHDAGIVHRDLKPSNLFLARPGGELLVKVLDFGIAKETHGPQVVHDRTTTGVVLGSPLYMSPEQARGGAVGPASDLWSLAVVAFEMITGTQPFLGASVGDVIAKICGDELPVPSRVMPSLPSDVDAFFERALRRNPARRFASARELAEAFAAVAAAHPDLEPTSALPKPEDGPSRYAETQPAEAPRLGRTGATAPLVIAVGAGASTDDTTAPAQPSPIELSAAMRVTELAPEPTPPAPASPLVRRAALASGAAAIVAIAYFLSARSSGPVDGSATNAAIPGGASAREASKPIEAATRPEAPRVEPSATVAVVASASAAPRPSSTATSEPPKLGPRPRASATATATAKGPRIDPFTGLPVQD